ncbi:FecR protein [Pararobbsia alpina]|uniref:DUF6600 domain-containing protein n=1 Tax=Pararobbsia alpina TaxID=621374 RepID=UPI0039A60643
MNKPQTWRIARAVSLTFLLAAIGSAAFGQEAPPPATQLDGGAAPVGDPPGRVARLNYFDGTVTMEPAGGTDWAYAELNRPMTTGDQVWVDNGGRSELHIGSTALRLGSQTSMSIVNLDDQNAQLKVAQGSLETRVRELPAGQSLEIDTPNLALQANGPGIYRVDASPDGATTTVTVRDGSAIVYGDNGSVQLGAGQQMTFSGTNLQQTGGGNAQALDPFDEWAYSRDRTEDGSPSARYVSRDIPGYQDLDANGSWEQSPDYGEVWVPRVAAGWAPYHQGHWAWVAPWGWTWVDDAPWGFAPFHYGRWAYWHNNWAWVPGPVVAAAPPCYSPALVAFVGGGNGGWNVSLAVGAVATAGVAWLALGPNEPWHPAYHYSPGYFNRVNYVNRTTIVNNTTIINNNHITYVNRNVPGAVMGMPANQFVHGQDTRRYGQPMQAAQIQRATFGAGAPAIAPVRQSFGGALRPANYRPPEAVGQRQVIATRTPPTPYAYHDTLAQNFAHGNRGTVPGAGQPVVRTAPPATYMRVPGPAAVAGRPNTPVAQPQARVGGQPGFRVVQPERHAPERVQAGQPGQPGQPGRPGPQGEPPRPQAGQPGQPNVPNAMRGQAEAGRPEQGPGAAPGNGVPRPPSAMQQQPGRPGMQPGGQPGGQANAQQEEAQRRQQQAAQEQQQRGQQAQQEQQRAQQAQEQQRAQQAQAQQEQQRGQQAQEQQRQQQEQQRAQQAQEQQRQQQEQQRSQQAQEQQRQQQEQQRSQQAQEQQRQQQEQQRAQQAQEQQRQQQEQQRAQQMQAQQRQQQEQQRQQQERAQQAQAQQQERAQQAQQAQQAQRQQQMQQMQQRQQQQQPREQPHPQPQQHEQGHRDQQSNSGHGREEHRG